MKRMSVMLTALAAVTVLPALADVATPGLDARQARQEQRIENGQANGSLTDKEAARLERKGDRVDRRETRMEADGKLTARERAKLNGAMNAQSGRIYRQKHDRQGN
ncbi:hypothetical protein [Chitinimonas naiadis]